jgi:hypothetical protein
LTRIKARGPVPNDAPLMNEQPIIDLRAEKILSLRAETQLSKPTLWRHRSMA